MNTELWSRLVHWEVRHALRGSTFWVMMAIALGTSLTVSRAGTSAAFVLPQMIVLVTMISLWVVFAVKRLLAEEMSDDWLLVLTYREALASRFAAGLQIGTLLYLAAAFGALATAGFEAGTLWLQLGVGQALLHGLALAAIMVGAADFLLAPVAVVLFVQAVLALLWSVLCGYSVVGPFFHLAALSEALRWSDLVLLAICLGGGAWAIWFGWRRAEDFWDYLRVAQAERSRASLGAVRTVVQAARRQGGTDQRQAACRARARFHQRGLDPLLSHDLARYPVGMSLRLAPGEGTVLTVIVATAMAFLGAYNVFGGGQQNTGLFLLYFCWWIAAAAVVFRALVSGAQIVVQEKEQGVLPHLVIAPTALGRFLALKLQVVLRQALIPLAALLAIAHLALPGLDTSPILIGVTLLAAVSGVVASSLVGSRLLATMLAAVLAVAISMASRMSYLVCPAMLRMPIWLVLLSWYGLAPLLLWQIGRRAGERALRVQAAR